jgi:hypothetical protein
MCILSYLHLNRDFLCSDRNKATCTSWRKLYIAFSDHSKKKHAIVDKKGYRKRYRLLSYSAFIITIGMYISIKSMLLVLEKDEEEAELYHTRKTVLFKLKFQWIQLEI